METMDEMFKRAEKYGITRLDIGKHIWGDNLNKRRIYLYKNPTMKSLIKVQKGIDELILMKKGKKTVKKG